MARVVYVDGRYEPWAEARVHAEDRGFQFADAIYEVCEIRDGEIVDETRHLERLERSLRELSIDIPMSRAAFGIVMRETRRRNRVRDGIVYMQVSRGVNQRDFLFPPPGTRPTVVCLARPVSRTKSETTAEQGIAIVSEPDPRWARCDIKTVMLLPSSLSKQAAKAQGAGEVWFTDTDGYVTEGGSSNAWIVTKNRELVTTPASNAILRGVTRMTLIDLVAREGLKLVERRFTIDEAKAAQEAFITSASNLVMPVVAVDGSPIGNGHPGSLTREFRAQFHEVAEHNP